MYKLSEAADDDVDEIFDYSTRQFGIDAAIDYHLSLTNCFILLDENPGMGRSVDDLREGYHRFEHESHVIFYILTEGGILIQRVLHNSRDVPRHIE